MKILDDEQVSRPSRRRLITATGVVLVCVALAGAWLLRRAPAPEPTPAPTPARTVAPVAAAPTPVAAPNESPTPTPVGRRRAARVAPPPSAEPALPALTLKVNCDVPGASVFVDRVYLGTAPLSTSDVTPGSHVVTVAAEGYESQASTVELSSGTTEVSVQFKVTRLNEAIAVVHKHTIGSCEGRLVADVNGLRYETANTSHALAIPFADLKTFEVDYLKKNLRIAGSDGKTFNFTDRGPNADALFVFHQKVQATRAKLAKSADR